jgi:hypothetical protein
MKFPKILEAGTQSQESLYQHIVGDHPRPSHRGYCSHHQIRCSTKKRSFSSGTTSCESATAWLLESTFPVLQTLDRSERIIAKCKLISTRDLSAIIFLFRQHAIFFRPGSFRIRVLRAAGAKIGKRETSSFITVSGRRFSDRVALETRSKRSLGCKRQKKPRPATSLRR